MDPGTLSAIQGFAAISAILFSLAVGVTGLRWVWRRMERSPGVGNEELEHLRAGLTRLDESERRVAELEERVDFAERLLAQQQPPERLPRG